MRAKAFSTDEFVTRYDLVAGNARILNAGSAETRFGANCLNVDVQSKENVDIVCDLHDLPADLTGFDAVICCAVLQYCRDPARVATNLHRALKPGGLLFVDAPWVQPYCPDTPDRLRFSHTALRDLFSGFEIIESGPSLSSGAALHMQAVYMARGATRNRYVNFTAQTLVGGLLYPLRFLRTAREDETAGAFYLIARRRAD